MITNERIKRERNNSKKEKGAKIIEKGNKRMKE